MKKIRIDVLGIEAKARNKREESMVGIFNNELEDIVRDWADPFWIKSFSEKGYSGWRFTELSGQASAMFYMGMIEEPISSVEIFEKSEEVANNEEKKTA